jgi:hypothetical protein
VHVDKTIAVIAAFTGLFQDFLTRNCLGELWTRVGMNRPHRSPARLSALNKKRDLIGSVTRTRIPDRSAAAKALNSPVIHS